MSKRLQVLLDEREYRKIQRIAKRAGISVSEWVRDVLRQASREAPESGTDRKLAAVGRAYEHALPTADLPQMLAEIEGGYLED